MLGEQKPDEEMPAVRWLPFQLNPDLPAQGISRQEHMERKFGPGAHRNYSHLINIGKEVGIDFAFDAIIVQPNTLNAHRLMRYGAQHGRENDVAENLFRAYFQEGANLTDLPVLTATGERAGLDRAQLESYLASDDGKDEVLRGDIEVRQAGINSVPFFIFNRRSALSGAHEAEMLLKAYLDSCNPDSVQATDQT